MQSHSGVSFNNKFMDIGKRQKDRKMMSIRHGSYKSAWGIAGFKSMNIRGYDVK